MQLFIQLQSPDQTFKRCDWKTTNVKDLMKTVKDSFHSWSDEKADLFAPAVDRIFHTSCRLISFYLHTHRFHEIFSLFSLHRCYLHSDIIDVNSCVKAAAASWGEWCLSICFNFYFYTCSYFDIKGTILTFSTLVHVFSEHRQRPVKTCEVYRNEHFRVFFRDAIVKRAQWRNLQD